MKDDKVFLTHVLESIGYIKLYVDGGKEEFFNSRIIQEGVTKWEKSMQVGLLQKWMESLLFLLLE